MLNIACCNAITIFLVVCSTGSAVAQPLPREKPAAGPSLELLAPPDAECMNWTDDCRACARSDGIVTCSNIATVCPAERTTRCLKREDPKPKKK